MSKCTGAAGSAGAYVCDKILPQEDEDLALLEVDFDDHPCVALDTDVRYDDPLYAAGFPDYGSGQQLDGVTGAFEARTSSPHPRESRYLLKVRGAQIVPGFSGGPLLNLRTGSIVGVMTETRGEHYDLGGWAVPAELVLREFSGVAEASAAWHARDPVWRRTVADWLEDGPFASRRARADDTLPLANNIRNFTEAYLGTPGAPEPFGGRDAALAELSAWLAAADGPPYLLLTAVAGRGKSALLVRWVQMLAKAPPGSGDCRVIFVPISLRYETSTAADVFSALASRLRRAHGESAPLPPDVNWQQAAVDALSRDAPDGSTLLVVIDGLDEAAGWRAGLATFPRHPGARVRMVVSARHTGQRRDNAAWRAALGWTTPEIAASMELPPLDGAGLRDVLTRMGSPLDALRDHSHVVDELARLTDGDPLLVRMYVKELWSQDRSARLAAADLRGLDKGLEGFFDWWWWDQEKQWGEEFASKQAHVRATFNVLATALGPLDRRHLLGLLARSPTQVDGDELSAALGVLDRFVVSEASGRVYVLAHPRFASYRYDTLKADGLAQKYDQLFLDWGADALADIARGAAAPPYVVRFLGAHLERAAADPASFAPLASERWRMAWESVAEDDSGFLTDLERASAAAREADRALVRAGKQPAHLALQFRCALARATMRGRAMLVAPQMPGALMRYGVWSARRAFAHVRRIESERARATAIAALAPSLDDQTLPPGLALLETLSPEEDSEAYAVALAALALRLLDAGRPDDARALIARCPDGYARGYARVELAARLDEAARRSLVPAILDEAASLDLSPRVTLVEKLTTTLPGAVHLSNDGRHSEDQHLGRDICTCWLCRACGLVVDYRPLPPHLPQTLRAQDLHFVVAWIPAPLRGWIAMAVLTKKGEDSTGVGLSGLISELAPWLDDKARARARKLATHIKAEGYRPIAMAALAAAWPAEREQYMPAVLASAEQATEVPGIRERQAFFADLVRAGEAETAVRRLLLKFLSRDSYAADMVEAVAPLLSEGDVRALLIHAPRISQEDRSGVVSPLLARLAELGRPQAEEALARASQHGDLEEQQLAQVSLKTYLRRHDLLDAWSDVIDFARSLPEIETRYTILSFAAGALGRVSGWAFAAAVDLLIDERSPVQSWRAVEIVGELAPHLDPDDVLAADVWKAVRFVAVEVAYSGKERHVGPWFRRAGELGFVAEALARARSLSSHSFRQPMFWAVLSLADSLNASLAGQVHTSLDGLEPGATSTLETLLDRAWLTAVRGVLVTRFGEASEIDAWRDQVAALEPFDVQRRSDAIAMMLAALPASLREWAANLLIDEAHLEPSLSREAANRAEPYVNLAPYLPPREVDKLIARLGDFHSSSVRDDLVSALLPRLVALGRAPQAFDLARWSHVDPMALRATLPLLADADVDLAFDAISTMPIRERPRVAAAVAARIARLPPSRRLALSERWLAGLAKGTRSEALLQTLGMAALIAAAGGDEAVRAVLAEFTLSPDSSDATT